MDQLLADEQVDWSDSDADGPVLWALADDQGSVRDVVDSSGKRRIERVFDSFGNVDYEAHYNASGSEVTAGQTGYIDEAFAFTGRWFDKATGLQNNLNRWYDASIGRWLSEDPIGFGGGDANLYRYVGNSPTWKTDPQGLADGAKMAGCGFEVAHWPLNYAAGEFGATCQMGCEFIFRDMWHLRLPPKNHWKESHKQMVGDLHKSCDEFKKALNTK